MVHILSTLLSNMKNPLFESPDTNQFKSPCKILGVIANENEPPYIKFVSQDGKFGRKFISDLKPEDDLYKTIVEGIMCYTYYEKEE